jgi:hypothetical protein
MRWLLSLRLPPRRPLGPTTSVLIREVVDVDDEVLADRAAFSAAGGRAFRKPVGLRGRLAVDGVSSFNPSSFERFDMRR